MTRTYRIENVMDRERAGVRTWRDGSSRTVTYEEDGSKVVVWYFPDED